MELVVSLYYYARKIGVRFAVDASQQPGLVSALLLHDEPAVHKHAAYICDCVQRGFKSEKKTVSRKVPAFDETTTVVEFEEFLQDSGIDVRLFGQGPAKPLKAFLQEVSALQV
jgi:hypothetical protein